MSMGSPKPSGSGSLAFWIVNCEEFDNEITLEVTFGRPYTDGSDWTGWGGPVPQALLDLYMDETEGRTQIITFENLDVPPNCAASNFALPAPYSQVSVGIQACLLCDSDEVTIHAECHAYYMGGSSGNDNWDDLVVLPAALPTFLIGDDAPDQTNCTLDWSWS